MQVTTWFDRVTDWMRVEPQRLLIRNREPHMSRVIFDNQPAAPAVQPEPRRRRLLRRAGARAARSHLCPPTMAAWLTSLGYPAQRRSRRLTNIPVLVESYLAFTSIFDDGSAGTAFGTDYVAAGVRSFFAQGGERCYVVRVDDPVTPNRHAAAAKPQN